MSDCCKKISPLDCSSETFASEFFTRLQRGREQALDLYKAFLRSSQVPKALPSCKNAPKLFEEMVELLDISYDKVVLVEHENDVSKFVIKTIDGHYIESVVMNIMRRKTLCISSQLGCAVGCLFCRTGQTGFIRNLSVREITQQLFLAKFSLHQDIQNIVFMGMGEPLSNMKNLMDSLTVLTDPFGFNIGLRHITIATSGDVDNIICLAQATPPSPNLAVSLNAADETLRSYLMPGRRESLKDLRFAMEKYCTLQKKEILVSYVIIQNINDSPHHAHELAGFLHALPIRINLIPFNEHMEASFSSPSTETVQQFTKILRSYGYPVFVRKTRGDSVKAACGQLAQKMARLP
jgi:23S rRNA (adenine2503-C2)-methyltransferase